MIGLENDSVKQKYYIENIKDSFETTYCRQVKRVAPDGAQTHTSCSLSKHPKQLDDQHYMLFTVFAICFI